jgi:hypothetical protein
MYSGRKLTLALDLEVKWIVSETPSESCRRVDFQPCVAICEKCLEE